MRIRCHGLVLGLAGMLALAGAAGGAPAVGAIRWDAWTGGEITAQVERSLGPPQFHPRLPWFAEVATNGGVRIDGSPAAVMDREIDLAADAGLAYWAFVLYDEASPMSRGLAQYLASPRRARLHFCLILHNTLSASGALWPAERDRFVRLLREPGYQQTPQGRPLVFVFQPQAPVGRLAELLQAARRAGVDPWLVYMGWNPVSDFRREASNGFAAVSGYAQAGGQATFAELASALERRQWQAAAQAGIPLVPLVTTGWDKRPRQVNPVSWEKDAGYHQQTTFPTRATPEEIAAHLGRAIDFVHGHPDICGSETIIMYAWNEHDEGGWLSPTWTPGGPDASRLDAIRSVLRPAAAEKVP